MDALPSSLYTVIFFRYFSLFFVVEKKKNKAVNFNHVRNRKFDRYRFTNIFLELHTNPSKTFHVYEDVCKCVFREQYRNFHTFI